MQKMKAIGYTKAGPLTADNALCEFELDVPAPGPSDLLVSVRGVSVNPVDVKIRKSMPVSGGPRILGFDASGVVTAVGSEVRRFKPGDDVYYAGNLMRPGSNAEFQLVDERIVGRKPTLLNYADAAGIPLTAITAWEILFDSLALDEGDGLGDAILIIGGAGGVGSILIQLAKQLTRLEVIATASRPETEAWVRKMGADHVINHRQPLNDEIGSLGIAPRFVAALTNTDQHFSAIIELIKPRGRIAVIDDPQTLDIRPLKPKALTIGWEFMFARPMFATDDMEVQHHLLNRVADMLDAGALFSTVNKHAGHLDLPNLASAHAFQESGTAIGKTVLDGMGSKD